MFMMQSLQQYSCSIVHVQEPTTMSQRRAITAARIAHRQDDALYLSNGKPIARVLPELPRSPAIDCEDLYLTMRQSRAAGDALLHDLTAPQQTEAAFGAAVLAASASLYPDLAAAARAMVHQRAVIAPGPAADRYAGHYAQFVAACRA